MLQEPAVCGDLPAQQAIPHSCDEAKDPVGTTPASTTSASVNARKIRAIGARAVTHAGRETGTGKLRSGREAFTVDGRILSQEQGKRQKKMVNDKS